MEDFWDLEAVVRGNCGGRGGAGGVFSGKSPARDLPSPCFEAPEHGFDELEQVYRPFYPLMPPQPPPDIVSPPPHLISTHTTASPSSSAGDSARTLPPGGDVSAVQPPTPKRKRKNQQKKIVHKVVTSEGPTSDKWAWRKYGQKPIKGSPYPRSYYRCSSSKGCLARKQVERSCSDPSMFIITYSADHDHDYPTRRSSLAGSTRSHKTFCSSSYAAKTLTADLQTPGLFKPDDSPNSNASSLSPATPPAAVSMEDEYAGREEGEEGADGEGSDDYEMDAEVGEWDLGMEISLEKWNGGNSSLPMDDGFLSFDDFSETFAY